ncbi:MAG: membrane protein insertion efficiency factor YidD [Betaproteobacteria bacterium]|nr:membrane protein insertion efficiency factor YidD [Betaproteobacteria bacterium]
MLTPALQFSVEVYRRYVSPHKGYRCAYAALHGRMSCSDWAVRVLKRRGSLAFVTWLPRRFRSCAIASRALMTAPRLVRAQAHGLDSTRESPEGQDSGPPTSSSKPDNDIAKICAADLGLECCCFLPSLF